MSQSSPAISLGLPECVSNCPIPQRSWDLAITLQLVGCDRINSIHARLLTPRLFWHSTKLLLLCEQIDAPLVYLEPTTHLANMTEPRPSTVCYAADHVTRRFIGFLRAQTRRMTALQVVVPVV